MKRKKRSKRGILPPLMFAFYSVKINLMGHLGYLMMEKRQAGHKFLSKINIRKAISINYIANLC